MDITWHGKSCFTLKGKNATVVIDPDKSIKTPLKGDVVLSSIGDDLAEVKDAKRTFTWPGEFEVSEVPITAIKAFTRSRSKEEEEGEDGERTMIFHFEIDRIKVCHLGNLGHKLTTELIDEIGDVDILLIPAGEESTLKGKEEVVYDQIESRIVIPYGKFDSDYLKKAFNAPFTDAEDKFTTDSLQGLPESKTQYVLLNQV